MRWWCLDCSFFTWWECLLLWECSLCDFLSESWDLLSECFSEWSEWEWLWELSSEWESSDDLLLSLADLLAEEDVTEAEAELFVAAGAVSESCVDAELSVVV